MTVDLDEFLEFTTDDILYESLPMREVHVVIYKNLCGYIQATYVWMEPTALIQIDADALAAIGPAYAEC